MPSSYYWHSVSQQVESTQKHGQLDPQDKISLSSQPAGCDAAFSGESIDADIDYLSKKVALWSEAYGGMEHWDSLRGKYVNSQLSHVEMQGYLDLVALGNDTLDECFILLRSSDRRDSVDTAFHLASRVIALSSRLSTGLERLRLAGRDTT
jgi:hypothetical protein